MLSTAVFNEASLNQLHLTIIIALYNGQKRNHNQMPVCWKLLVKGAFLRFLLFVESSYAKHNLARSALNTGM